LTNNILGSNILTMGKIPITVMGYRCERCGHEWVPRDFDAEPRVCPKCKSPYWNSPRKATMTYETFKDTIRETLQSSSQPMTWTEIRTSAKLPQAVPNNQWVRKLETDIGLQRKRDNHGIIYWSLKQ
jgi:predicted Zn-ribbon and HTH transcriptional regulator